MTHAIRPQPGIDRIKLYQGGESRIAGRDEALKLSSNENPFGTSDKARAAFARTAGQLHRYPPTDHAALRAALAEIHGLDAGRIVCGVGSDELLALLCHAYAGPGDEVVYTEHGFSLYRTLTLAAGAEPVEVAERDRVVDVDAILAGVTARTRIVMVTNPGNPTATMIGNADLARLAEALPPAVLLILDGAYAEFADGYDGGAGLVAARENVVMTRTFSKLYGLGGLRIGWAYGPGHVVDTLNRMRGPFNLSETQLATAEAALRDREFAEFCLGENARMRTWLADELAAIGVPSDPSSTNFLLARFRDQAEADACDAALREDGILVRRVAGYKLPDCLRITIGTEADCRRVRTSIARFMEGRR